MKHVAILCLTVFAALRTSALPEAPASEITPARIAAKKLNDKLKAGTTKGVTANGRACAVTHFSLPDVDPSLIEYTRTEIVIMDKTGLVADSLDVEFFYDGDQDLDLEIGRGPLRVSTLDRGESLRVIEGQTQRIVEITRAGDKLECRLAR